jgi:hypothetical protein
VTGSAGDYKVYQLTNQFEHSFIPGLIATEYAFGVWVPVGGTEDCEFAIEDVVVYQNTSAVDIVGLETGMWLDFDISSGGTGDLADYDQQHHSIWMYDAAAPDSVFGMTMKPLLSASDKGCCFYGTPLKCADETKADCKTRTDWKVWIGPGECVDDTTCDITQAMTGYGFSQTARVYDGQYMDSLKYWMENLGWGIDNPTTPEDKSIIISNDNIDIAAGGFHLEKWLKWGYGATIGTGGDANWRHFLYNILHQEGFYRGDVNKSGKLDVTDVIYTINYLFKDGPSPIEFVDQGDVNIDDKTTVTDVIYEINYLFKGGPAPIDKNRWLDKSPFVDAAYKASAVRDPGLFGDDEWKTLGQ